MNTLCIQLVEIDANCVELRYWDNPQAPYETQILPLSAIQDLVREARREYYLGKPRLKEIGQRLFAWLDGDGRWLSRAINNCCDRGIILAIDTAEKLSHLPWEVLRDRNSFLVERVNPAVIPVRWIDRKAETKSPQARSLRILFMATAPLGVKPELDFEAEEGRILEATEDLGLTLRVEESGCMAELGKLWSRYEQGYFDIFHLTGHASIQTEKPYHPYFIAETETGERHDTFPAEIAKVFRFRFPPLIFLSGCRTGQASQQGAVLSLAEQLIHQGANAVLGWGLPVYERTATAAAAHLYEKLAAGYQVPEALASTYSYLLQEEEVKDWHLLRLYVRGKCPGALVEPPGEYYPEAPEYAYEQFLDPLTQQVRVATPQEFVGRRRALQRCLRALRGREQIGVLLHGMGGVGKSTVAARLLERIAGYDRIFIYRGLDGDKLLKELMRQCTNPMGLEILQDRQLPLMQRLTKFLQVGLNRDKQQFAFILDDFEANLEESGEGRRILKPDVVEVLRDLLEAIFRSRHPHRVIITCRYDFPVPDRQLDRRLYREQIKALRGAELRKKCNRLTAFQEQSGVEKELQEGAIRIADGNPRLLEWLDLILQAQDLETAPILQQMEGKAAEFREDILAEELLKQQPEGLRQVLGLALVYELPVPKEAIAAICPKISRLDQYLQRASSLGLIEVSASPSAPLPSRARRVPVTGGLYRVPRILEPLLPFSAESEELHQQAAQVLYRLWWEEAEGTAEEQALEIHRLAVRGKQGEIAANIASLVTSRWKNQSRFQEAVKTCQKTLEVVEDYRIFHQLARAEGELGEVNQAIKHYQKASEICPPDDEPEKAAIIHNLAGIYARQGEVEQAIALYQQSLELTERIGDVQGKAATLHCLALIYAQQGEVERAIAFYEQSLELTERIGDGGLELFENTPGLFQHFQGFSRLHQGDRGCHNLQQPLTSLGKS